MLSYPDTSAVSIEEIPQSTAVSPSHSQRSSLDVQRSASPSPPQSPIHSPSPPSTEPPAPPNPSAAALSHLHDAANEFVRCFPGHWQIIETSAEGLLCGWHAVILSLCAQYPALPYPTLGELITVFERQSAEFAQVFDMENTDNFSVDQVGAVLYSWGRERGLNLRLGYLEEGASPLLVSHPNEDEDVLVVWIHNDGLWNGGIGHFSGMNRWVEMDPEQETGGFDDDPLSQISSVSPSPSHLFFPSPPRTRVEDQSCEPEQEDLDIKEWRAYCEMLHDAMAEDEDDFDVQKEHLGSNSSVQNASP